MKRMLFNATQQEELRVAIVDGQKLIDIDIETAKREQRKSNIYKGIITRIEPSLEACFVNYGEDRHGFLPFKEITPSYFKEGIDIRNASIKEALHENQEIIVQVEKEERSNKGAALTSFISLAGRYLVLMPNNPRGGGVSRRVEGEDRQELREAMDKLDLQIGMSVIARTAGIGRNVNELQWDLNYLMQLWRAIESAGQLNTGPFLIYQESSLVIRAIRDYFQPDIGEILIDTDDIYNQAQQFMAHVMSDMVYRVKRYRDDVPLFSRFQIEHQIETVYSRTVSLPSGGAIVIDHTEALVSVDVNSARATRGSDIETTAFYTNFEAADEVARQLRLRDLGGLIVIDFIDMENTKNQREVELRLKDALHYDRARVQMGKISRFGLMELSRQRLRPSLSEGSHTTCPRCNGTGHIRNTESSALQVLRIIQEEAMKENSAAIHIKAPVDVAAFLLNEKRIEILEIETRHRVVIIMIPHKHLETPHYKIERIKHDDPRLDDNQTRYNITEQIDTNIGYMKYNKEEIKPRQEAIVKGIKLGKPAPIVEQQKTISTNTVPKLAPESGLMGKLWSFFRKKPVTSVSSATVFDLKKTLTQDQNERNNNRNRNRSRHHYNRNEREERDEPIITTSVIKHHDNIAKKKYIVGKLPYTSSEFDTCKELESKSQQHKDVKELQKENFATLEKSTHIKIPKITKKLIDNSPEDVNEPRRRRNKGGRNRNRREREVNNSILNTTIVEMNSKQLVAHSSNKSSSMIKQSNQVAVKISEKLETFTSTTINTSLTVDKKNDSNVLLHNMLTAAGLILKQTDPEKLRAAQEAAAQIITTPRVPRERKHISSRSTEQLIQIEQSVDESVIQSK